ncbi:hypothetical protein HPB51_018951 [Rhipicephalus microplus]|uniref:Uncharacterized protein n=1 Tax=Rhipicephalus microplus TaxID=6941 RepID=A0A9J6D631_RHIMP|nr:hypothetical protein HPB51_018951 [Rhipicephalus microplus]
MALQENSTLQKLEVELSWFSSRECCLLLKALSKGNSIQSVALRYFPNDIDLVEVCRAVRDCGLDGRVHIEDYDVVLEDAWILPACREVKSFNVTFGHSHRNLDVLRHFFGVAASCYHLTSLCVSLYSFDEGALASLAAYITESHRITEFMLLTEFSEHSPSFIANEEAAVQSMSNVIVALSSNTRITSIHLYLKISIGDRDCQVLADAASNNRQLRELSVSGMNASMHVFLDRLLIGLQHSYNLLRLELPFCDGPTLVMCAVQELVRRNGSLVDRATRFVMGDRSWYCACASSASPRSRFSSPTFERRVAATEEADNLIRGAQKFVRFMNVHEYMKMTGVVQGHVECETRKDRRLGLDQLYYDCWLHIRRYLLIGDVLKH